MNDEEMNEWMKKYYKDINNFDDLQLVKDIRKEDTINIKKLSDECSILYSFIIENKLIESFSKFRENHKLIKDKT